MKGDRNGALREVLVPVLSIGEGQEWTTIRDENEMYRVLLQRNQNKFMASAKNPFAEGPLNELIGHMGEKPAADALLDGTFLDKYRDQLQDILTPEFEEFLTCMKKHPNATTDIDPEITVEDYQALFRKNKADNLMWTVRSAYGPLGHLCILPNSLRNTRSFHERCQHTSADV